MNTDDNNLILGKKTREKLISDYDTRNLQSFFSYVVFIAGIIAMFFFTKNGQQEIGLITVVVGSFLSMILYYLGSRCPICDKLKNLSHRTWGIFSYNKGRIICKTCHLEDDQMHKYFDLLIRNVEINKETIAQFNKRDL